MLQGIYSYISLINDSQYSYSSTIKKYKPKLKDINILAESEFVNPETHSSYNGNIYNLSTYKISEIDVENHPHVSKVLQASEDKGVFYLFIAENGVLHRSSLVINIMTFDLTQYLSGVLFLDRLISKNDACTTFGLYLSPDLNNFHIFNSLTGFAFPDLPNEIINQITSYYPCDWLFVNKLSYQLTNGKSLSDARIPLGTRKDIVRKLLKSDVVSDADIQKLVEYVGVIPLVSGADIDYVSSLLELMKPSLRRVMKVLTDRIISSYSLRWLVSSFPWDKGIIYAEYILDRYSDEIYFGDIPVFSTNSNILAILIRRRLVLFPPLDIPNTLSNISDDNLTTLTWDILVNKGVLIKTDTNPATNIRKSDHKEKSSTTDVKHYIAHLIIHLMNSERGSEINFEHNIHYYPRLIRLLYTNLDLVPDAPYYSTLMTFLTSTAVSADMSFFDNALTGLLKSSHIELKDIYDYISNYIPKTGIAKYGYPDDFVKKIMNKLRSHPNYAEGQL
jgi:hypothetical protein